MNQTTPRAPRTTARTVEYLKMRDGTRGRGPTLIPTPPRPPPASLRLRLLIPSPLLFSVYISKKFLWRIQSPWHRQQPKSSLSPSTLAPTSKTPTHLPAKSGNQPSTPSPRNPATEAPSGAVKSRIITFSSSSLVQILVHSPYYIHRPH